MTARDPDPPFPFAAAAFPDQNKNVCSARIFKYRKNIENFCVFSHFFIDIDDKKLVKFTYN